MDRARLVRWLAPLVLLCMIAVEAYGFRTHPLFSQRIWDPDGWERLGRYSGWFLALAAPILVLVPWAFAAILCGLLILLTAMSTGPAAVVAVAYFIVSAAALGGLLLGRRRHVLAIPIGLAVYILLMTLTARLPIHYGWSWGILLAIPIAFNRHIFPTSISVPMKTWAERVSFALLTFVIGMHWLLVLKPEKSADGLAMHLAIPAKVAQYHHLPFEPNLYMWSVMPMGGDFCYSITYLFGGEFASRLFTFAALMLVLALLNHAIRPMVAPALRYLFLLLFATTPLVQLVTGSLFVENIWAAVILASITAVWQFMEARDVRYLFAGMGLAGTAMACKFGSLSFVAMILPLTVAEALRQGQKARRRLPAALLLFLVAAVPTYLIAWSKTGNPIFPFLNEKIHSRLVDPTVGFGDYEFTMPLTWRTPYQLTFETSRFYEAQNGSFGFQYLILLPLIAVALLILKRRALTACAIALGAAILTYRSDPNARYLYPALPLMLIAAAGLLQWLADNTRYLWRGLAVCLAVCAVLNIYFLPASGWYHKDFYMKSTFRRDAAGRYIRDVVPIRYVVRHFNQVHPGEAVFFTDDVDVPDPSGSVFENHWHQFPVVDRLRHAEGIQDVRRIMDGLGVRSFISRKPSPGEQLQPKVLAEFLEKCTVPEFEWSLFRLSRLEEERCVRAP